MKSLWITAALFAVGCGTGAAKDATPAGTVLVTWDAKQSTRPAIRVAAIGGHVVKDVTYTAHPTPESTVTLAIHVETAPVTLVEDGKRLDRVAPVAVTVTATDSDGFRIGPGKCTGPDYGLDGADMMLMDCAFKATKPKTDVGFMFDVYSDGTVDDGATPRRSTTP